MLRNKEDSPAGNDPNAMASVDSATKLKVAVCICTYNRPTALDKLLEALREVDWVRESHFAASLSIVDNLVDGRARAVFDRHRSTYPVPLHFVEEPERGISFARNRAIDEALEQGADAIAFIDDDDVPRPDWLRELLVSWREAGSDLTFGSWQFPSDFEIPSHLSKIMFFRPVEPNWRNRHKLPPRIATCNVLICGDFLRRFREDGPVFDPNFALTGGGDKEFFIRATKSGASYSICATSIVIRHWDAGRVSLAGVLRRSFRLGCVEGLIARKHYDPMECKRMRKRSLKKVRRLSWKLPRTIRSPEECVHKLFSIADEAGKFVGVCGLKYNYYK
jgi:succinoglycan biosynthesis protein ExoM